MAVKKKAKKKASKKPEPKGRLVVEYVPIASLKPWAKNPRLNDETVDSIVKSIEKFGYTNPVLVRRADNRIIAGHTRVKALTKIGETVAPVIFMDIGKTDADLYALFDNKSTENTAWDPPKLSELFIDLKEMGADIELTGFSLSEISGYSGELNDRENKIEYPDEMYAVVVECESEEQQKEFYEEQLAKGRKCRLMTL